MRLTSAEVKRLLAHGRRSNAVVAGFVLSSRTLVREDALSLRVDTMVSCGAVAVKPTITPTQAAATIPARIALAVPKRQLKRAVDRNLVKRILRETFRQHQVRDAGTDILVTLTALPKVGAATTAKRPARKNLRLVATALFTKLAAPAGDR